MAIPKLTPVKWGAVSIWKLIRKYYYWIILIIVIIPVILSSIQEARETENYILRNYS